MNEDLQPLIEILEVVKPYLGDIVLVGGWVPIVYGRCTPIYPTKTVRTADVDFACLAPLDVRGDTMDRLLNRAGFRCDVFGNTDVPYCRYFNDRNLEIEFLTPLKGDGCTVATELQQGLTAENLRYLDVLLAHTNAIRINEELIVKVPWISAFLFHKGLSFPDRRSTLKRDKDLYYIFKILETVDREYLLPEMKQVFRCHPGKWRTTFTRNLEKYFRDEHSPGVASVVSQLEQIPAEQSRRDVLAMRAFTTMERFAIDLKHL